MRELIIPFVRREKQVAKLNEAIKIYDDRSNSIVIRGESGSGKTSLLRNTLSQYINNDDYTVIYLNLNADILSCSIFYEELLFTVWNPVERNEKAMLSISKKQSFQSYITRSLWSKSIAKHLYQVVISSLASIPTYGALVSKALDMQSLERKYNDINIDKLDYITKYLRYICKSKKVILSIDNYQFIPQNIKTLFESSLEELKQNLSFITIFRENNEDIFLPLCFASNRTEIVLSRFDYEDTYSLLKTMYHTYNIQIQEISHDCFGKTSGNLKEIEIYLKENDQYIIKGIVTTNRSRSLKQIITQMPEIQRYLVLLSAMFPAGLKIEYVTKIMNNIILLNNEKLLMDELRNLITLGYVVINSAHNDLLKPAHEKITISLSEIQGEDDFIEFYNSIRCTLEQLIEAKNQTHDYVYMLHCIIGLYNTSQLIGNMNYLIDLIRIEYDCCAFYYIVSIYKQTQEITESLPDMCIHRILDSCQKTSEFSIGISLMERLKRANSPLYGKYQLYEIKYLTQSYDFEVALDELKTMEETNEILLNKLNILQHMGRNSEALQHVQNISNLLNQDKWYHLIMRNSAHYFTYQDALYNLEKCLDYFKKSGTKFDQATVLNNIGVIHVWNKNYEDARKLLNLSAKLHQSINSNEIFEVYCNLGVLEFLEGNIKASLENANKSIATVPQSLTLDHIILKINEIIFEYAFGQISMRTAYEELLLLYNNSIINKDPWVRFQVVYNLYSFEDCLHLGHTEQPDDYYITKNKQNQHTCFEILTKLTYDSFTISVSLSLSPNWRY